MKKHENKSEAAALRQKAEELLKKKSEAEILELVQELATQNEEKVKRADELVIANKELAFQNEEKEKRADELRAAIAYSLKLTHELQVHQVELEMQNDELNRAKEQIAIAAHDKYAELYDFAPSGYFTLSKEGNIIELNLCGSQMLGKDRTSLKNKEFGFFVSDDTKNAFNLFLEKVFNNKAKETCSLTLSATGNLPVYVHLTGIVNQNEEQCQITAVDITERKQAEDRVNQLAAIVLSSEDAIIGKNLDGVITSWNKGAEKIYGYTENEVIGKPVSMLSQSGNDDEIPYIPDNIKPNQVMKHYETSHRRKDGKEIQVSLTISPILDSVGRIIATSIIARDFTEHKLAEKAIDEHRKELIYANSQLALAQQTGHVGSWNFNLKTQKLSGSDEARRLFGLFDHENTFDLQHIEACIPDRERVHQALINLITDGTPYNLEYTINPADGSEPRVITSKATIEKDSASNPVSVMGIIQDTTENKLVQEKLLSQTMLLEAQLNSTIDGILIVDKDNNRILINRRMIQQFNVPADIIEDKNDSKLLKHVMSLTKNPGKFLEKILYLNNNPDKAGSDEIEFANGMVIDRYSAPVIGRDGQNFGRIWIFRDITERKLAEEKVREKDIQFEKLSSQVSDLIYQFTRRPDGSYYVPIASAGIKNIFGCSPEDVRADFGPIANVIFHEDSARVISDIEYSAQHLTDFNCEFRVQIPGRELQWILSRSVPEKLMDGSITWYGFTANITSIKSTEHELIKAKEKAEESDKLKSAFLANMSHEIRTPMNGILGFAGLLKEPGLKGEEQQKYIRIIEKSGARMLNIINDIVDISKIEAGQMEVALSNVNVNAVTESFYTFFKPEAEKKGIQLILKNSLPSKVSVINTDSNKFDSVLSNLIKNAIKFTHSGSIEFGYTRPHESFLQFFVKDTGIGIPKERQEAIFERFIQADIFDKQVYQGAGLGLAISKAYIEMLGGQIWLESEGGQGSVFYFTIPYIIEEQVQTNIRNILPAEEESGQIKNLKILIAEDDETSDLLITTMLKNCSHEVLHVNTGDQAVEFCRNNRDVDLVLMDIRMPGISGYEATRQIRQFNKDVVIIAQTAYGLSGDRENAIESGCNDYISKPINKEELLQLIQKHFKK